MNVRLPTAAFLLLSIVIAFQPAAAQDSTAREAIVKIYVIRDQPDFFNPWSMTGPQPSTGSGSVIAGKRILTNAHVVRDQTFIQVRRFGSPKRYVARVLSVSHEADLALLTVDDEAFFEGIRPLKIGGLPDSQEEVYVYGFPLGGDTLSITKGVVSRMEHRTYVHGGTTLFAGQIDAAINAGNSGGPVLQGRKIVGVAMQSVAAKSAENIGYMVPVPILRHYLADLEDGRYDGFPTLGVIWQKLENSDLRQAHDMPDEATGVLVVKTLPGTPAAKTLQIGDVLLNVEGHAIGDDGTVEFRSKDRTGFQYYIEQKQIGESLRLDVLRAGQHVTLRVDLDTRIEDRLLVPLHRYDQLPTYYIYGGLVFTPLSKALLLRWGKDWYNRAPKHLVAKLSPNIPEQEGEEVIVLLKILASDLTQGYHEYQYWVVEQIDDKEVLNMQELARLVSRESDKQYISFASDLGVRIVLDRQKVREQQQKILSLYRIPSQFSKDLEPSVLSAQADLTTD